MARMGVTATKGASNVLGILYLNAAAASPRRAKILDVSMGFTGTPADAAFTWQFQRCTTAPTATALTPNALDPADSLASTIVANNLVTVDGTLTASATPYGVALNQRNSFRWVAVPGAEVLIPATASNGIMVGLSAASTVTAAAGAIFEEL